MAGPLQRGGGGEGKGAVRGSVTGTFPLPKALPPAVVAAVRCLALSCAEVARPCLTRLAHLESVRTHLADMLIEIGKKAGASYCV
eukprot:7697089-Pyramimonas_sp.AAC.2